MPRFYPERDAFLRLHAGAPAVEGLRVPVSCRLLADRLTPVSAFASLTAGDTADHAFLLESVVAGERIGRYSLLGVAPSATWELRQGDFVIRHGAASERRGKTADPLSDLRALLGDAAYARDRALPGFTGGLVGYVGYDLARYYELAKLGGPSGGPPDDRGLPDAVLGLYDACVIFDHVDKTLRVVAHATPGPSTPAAAAYDVACGRIESLLARLRAPAALDLAEIDTAVASHIAVEQSLGREAFEQAVRRGIEYIRAGDIFQFVPSVRFRARSPARPLDVYRALRVINPSPYMFYLRTPACTLIGNSPEILCAVRDRRVVTRPLAGTRRRGDSPERDAALAAELLADPKERAEHVMLVDLHRNDVGRVARMGSVRVDELMSIERYSHVMHIVSNVSAELADGCDAFDALRVSLPVGTVSGAPKVRAMQIIDELEPVRRGPYAGAVGHVDFGGDMDTCIALRTIVWHRGCYDVQAGAGVVADSVPAREYEECLGKAQAMLLAIQIAETGLG